MTTSFPKLSFTYPFDERCAIEAKDRGFLQHLYVTLSDGTRHPVVFYDPVRLSQDLETETEEGSPFIADKGMIVVAEVTLENMEVAIAELYLEGFFNDEPEPWMPPVT